MDNRRRTRRKLRRRQKGGISFGSLGSKLGSLGSKIGSIAKKGVSATKTGFSNLKSKFAKKPGDSGGPVEASSIESSAPASAQTTSSTTEVPAPVTDMPPSLSNETSAPATPMTVATLKETGTQEFENRGFKRENIDAARQQVEHDIIPELQQKAEGTSVEEIEKLAKKGRADLATANEAFGPFNAMIDAAKEQQQSAMVPSSSPSSNRAAEIESATKAVEVISRVGTQEQKDQAVAALLGRLKGGKRRTHRAKKHKKKKTTRRH